MTWRWFSVTLPNIKNTDYISPNYAVKKNKTNKSIMRRVIKFIKQILQRIGQMSYNAPFCNRNVHMCAHFCYEMVHCGIWDWCIMGFICNRSILNTMKIQWKMWYIYSFSWYIEVRKNSRHFADNIFKMHFLEWKLIYFDSNFIEVYFMASNWKWVSTGSDNGLTLNRWQTIMWSNDDPFQWCIMHSLCITRPWSIKWNDLGEQKTSKDWYTWITKPSEFFLSQQIFKFGVCKSRV